MITCDVVIRLPEGITLLLPNDYDPNKYTHCEICVRITHAMGFVHYVPMHEITHSKNYVTYNAPMCDDVPAATINHPEWAV